MGITISERIKELGLVLPTVAKPLAAYIPAKIVGNQIWTSGQLPLIDGEVMFPGHVGGAVTEQRGIEASRRAALNAIAAAGQAAGSVDYLTRVLKATV
ncbi:MAG: RidA family protein, partial [Propionibacteriaceae bacterium]